MNILVVEDDEQINQLLCEIIRQMDYTPTSAYSGTEALLHLENKEWQMVLLDLMLPGLAGEEVLQKVREKSNIPVIIISAKLETESKIATLRAGADDYITKPFELEEVMARIEACFRRFSTPVETEEIHFKNMIVNKGRKTVSIHGKRVKLTTREYEILLLLLSNPKKIFTKANLFTSVWQEEYYGDDNTINVHMSNLRNVVLFYISDKTT